MQYTLEGFEAPPELTSEEEKSNQQLQTKIREILIEFQYVEDSKVSAPKTFKCRVPYEDLYGLKAISAFVINHPLYGLTRIEPHQQQVSGSVDRKFPFFLQSAYKAPEPNVIILIEGQGHKKAAFEWLKTESAKCTTKNIRCFDLADFALWI
ncbi:hypothetical protein HNP12_001193 [Aeromonas hydrophila]|uniref:PD-(D/E)XK nuclease superfamily protein n=1 Tax=Aeromonas hydrophila TaxID=644 RepID=UPI002167FA9E|nr:PD-(D/E)XK nuclease superfamily protein [Aeromonas hydrophila]MCS3767136.1 hypothetical protein [Aeromonas hydrophila]MCS3790567.1 hypothetical protein [Aeromonas hydrophila]